MREHYRTLNSPCPTNRGWPRLLLSDKSWVALFARQIVGGPVCVLPDRGGPVCSAPRLTAVGGPVCGWSWVAPSVWVGGPVCVACGIIRCRVLLDEPPQAGGLGLSPEYYPFGIARCGRRASKMRWSGLVPFLGHGSFRSGNTGRDSCTHPQRDNQERSAVRRWPGWSACHY